MFQRIYLRLRCLSMAFRPYIHSESHTTRQKKGTKFFMFLNIKKYNDNKMSLNFFYWFDSKSALFPDQKIEKTSFVYAQQKFFEK